MATETTLVNFIEGAAASTPSANRVVTYAKADGLMYSKDDAGVETLMSAGAAATRASLGLDTTDSPQFAGINVGHASDTTLARASAGNLTVEGNALYRAGGTDVPVADGGTGASTATAGFNALSPVTTRGDLIIRDATNNVRLPIGSSGKILTSDGTDPSWQTPASSGVTVSENRLTGDVSITADTYADGPSLSLLAGTYLLDGHVTVYGTTAGWVTVKLMNGATAIDSCDGYVDTATAGLTFPVGGYVVLGGTTTVKIQATVHLSAAGTIKATPQFNTTGLSNTASYLRATKIA